MPHLRFPLVLFILSLALAAQNVHPQSPPGDSVMSWLQQEQRKIEQRLAVYDSRESEIQTHIRRAQELQARAAQNGDSPAREVARQAIDTANQALTDLRTARELDRKNLAVLHKAAAVYQQCGELRTKAEKDREALRRQIGASDLTGEGSSSQPGLIASRTGMAAAHLAILANQFNQYNKLLVEAAQNAEFITRHAGDQAAAAIVPAKDGWNALNAMRTTEECKDQLKTIFTHTQLTEKTVTVAKCAESLEKTAHFLQAHGKALEQVGKAVGIAVPGVEFANDVVQLHEDMKSLATYTQSNPESALRAARALDDRQRATLQRLSDCQMRFTNIFTGLP